MELQGAIPPLIVILLASLSLEVLALSALPLMEVRVIDANATGFALSRDLLAYASDDGTLTVIGEGGTWTGDSMGGRLISGRDVFLQAGDSLYLVTPSGLERVAQCSGCSFIPYSRSRVALWDSGWIKLPGGRVRVGRRGRARWSDDGSRISIISGDQLTVINSSGYVILRKDLNSQVLDSEPAGDITYVCMKGCEVYAIRDNSFLAWNGRLCKCCIPGRLEVSGDRLLVLLQGRSLAVLDRRSGKLRQSIPLEGYEIHSTPGVVGIRDGRGRIHILVDSSRLSLAGESGGVLGKWDLPDWIDRLGASVRLGYPGGWTEVPVGKEVFSLVPRTGDLDLRVLGSRGAGVTMRVRVSPLEVSVSPWGDVSVSGSGSFSVEVGGRVYRVPARVDAGWLPTYRVRILNHGVVVGEAGSINARFVVLSAIIPLLVAAWAVRRRRAGRSTFI